MIKRFNEFVNEKVTTYTDMGGGLVHRVYIDDTYSYLDYSEDDGAFFLIKVEVEESRRHQGIATKLLEMFFKIVNNKNGVLDISTYLPDGEKYLRHVIERLKPKYPNIEFME